MQDYITKEYLINLGISLDDHDIESLLTHLNETVEERIGVEIAQSLSDDQLVELVKLQEDASDEELAKWITAHVPDYLQIVQDNIDIVISEIVENTDDINKVA